MNIQTQANLTQQITLLKKQYSQLKSEIFQINNQLLEKSETISKLAKIQLQTPSEETHTPKSLARKKAINQLQQEIDTLKKDIQSLETEKNNIGETIDQLEEDL
jgi:predicted  nucleic acid-binding Zn-ribbon protein